MINTLLFEFILMIDNPNIVYYDCYSYIA